MLTYRLKNSLISSEDSDWKQLVLQSLGETVHPKRANGFCLAREALRECFSHLGIQLSVGELVLEGYSKVTGHDSLTISLAHTPDWGAALVAEASKFQSVGIDIEPMSRVVKPLVLARITNPKDLSLSPLSIWTLKEAVFKAVMNTGLFEKPVEFSSLQISENTWSHESGLTGFWELGNENGMLMAKAWILRSS